MTGHGEKPARQRTRSVRRRRFLFGSVAALAALAVSMGVSFLSDTGTATLTLSTPASDSFVYSVAGNGSAPTAFSGGLRYGTAATGGSFAASVTTPSWTPAPSTAGSVTSPGDLALIDATGTTMPNGGNVLVSIYITNLSTLSTGYSSYAFPIEIFSCKTSCTTSGSSDTSTGNAGGWSDVTSATPLSSTNPTVFLTSNAGFVTFSLPYDYYYDITIPKGGSFYTLSGVTSSSATPTYYITAQRS